MADPISFAKATHNGEIATPEEALKDALEVLGKKGAFEKGKKLLILCVDDTNEEYKVSFIQAGMRMSGCLTLCDIAKNIFKTEMGY